MPIQMLQTETHFRLLITEKGKYLSVRKPHQNLVLQTREGIQ